jgi:hypothetical protein
VIAEPDHIHCPYCGEEFFGVKYRDIACCTYCEQCVYLPNDGELRRLPEDLPEETRKNLIDAWILVREAARMQRGFDKSKLFEGIK